MSELIACPHCGRDTRASAEFCTKCGRPIGRVEEPAPATSTRKRLALVVVTVAVAIAAVVGLGRLFDGGGASRTPAPNAAVPTPAAARDETPEAFLADFTKAVRDADAKFINGRYDPAVIERYGKAQCRQESTPKLFDPTYTLEIITVSGPQQWSYASDSEATKVPNVYVFDVKGTVRGEAATRSLHFSKAKGKFRVFADCGEPVG